MPSKTYHVVPAHKGWILRKAGAPAGKIFTTQQEAIDDARKLLTPAAGQIVIHNASGKIRDAEYHRLPKIQPPPMRGGLKARKIEKAVNSIVLDACLSLAH